MGADLIDSLRDEFKRGFNSVFYGIGNYTYNYTLAELDDQEQNNDSKKFISYFW